MKRYLGLDLGVKTCGVSITDRSNTVILPYTTINFKNEDYKTALKEIKEIIEKESITDVVIGLPLNMDGTKGFAAKRTLNFVPKLEKLDVNVVTYDERLTTMEAERILHECNIKEKQFKEKIDMQAASLILEAYLRSIS